MQGGGLHVYGVKRATPAAYLGAVGMPRCCGLTLGHCVSQGRPTLGVTTQPGLQVILCSSYGFPLTTPRASTTPLQSESGVLVV